MATAEKERPSYYAVVPAHVRYDKTCSPAARLLYGEIAALTNREGYCWASNQYFAELYEVDDATASSWVAQLAAAGHVIVEVSRTDGNRRKIWLAEPWGVSGKSRRAPRKKPERSPGKAGDPSPGKAGDITPSLSTTKNGGRVVTDAFWSAHEEKTGAKPLFKAQYKKWADRIWTTLRGNEALLAECVRSFFSDDWFFTLTRGRSGERSYSFDGFFQHFNDLLSRGALKLRGDRLKAPAPVNGNSLTTIAVKGGAS